MELSLGSTYDRRAELSLEDAPEDHLLEALLPNRFIMSAYNFLKIKNLGVAKILSTKLHKIDSNYSWGYIEAIASIQTT